MAAASRHKWVPALLLLEVETQARFVAWAADQLSTDQGLPDSPNAGIRLWFSVQTILVSAANITKAMWGGSTENTKRDAQKAERAPLRMALALTSTSPLYKLQVRNDLEHLEATIDHWGLRAQPSASANVRTYTRDPEVAVPRESLGHYNVATGDVTFKYRHHSANVPKIVTEAARILPLASAEARRLLQRGS